MTDLYAPPRETQYLDETLLGAALPERSDRRYWSGRRPKNLYRNYSGEEFWVHASLGDLPPREID